jgi:GPI transamidase subunit PIG-U
VPVERAASPRVFWSLLLVGLILRAAGLPLRGTDDMDVWKLWTHAGSINVSTMYGVGGDPPERAVLVWGKRSGTVEYPPATLFALAAVGHIYRAIDPYYTDSVWLTVAVKLSILLGDIGSCVALWALMRRYSETAARTAVLFYWLNPAVILDGAVLGYLDPWLGALTMASILAIDRGRHAWAGVALALTALTKLQIALILPAVALLLFQRTPRAWWKPALTVALAAVVTAAIVIAPFARIGALPNLIQGAGRAFHHDMLSAEAVNVWWIATWILRRSWTTDVRILGISRAVALGYPNPRLIGTALAVAVMLWAFWRARRARLPVVLAAGALAIHAYTLLSVQVHENHFYLALPLIAAAGAVLPAVRAPYMLASAICLLNLFLFQGFGHDFDPPPRLITVVDATVLLSFVNIGAFVWHARRFARVTAGAMGFEAAATPSSAATRGGPDSAASRETAPGPPTTRRRWRC